MKLDYKGPDPSACNYIHIAIGEKLRPRLSLSLSLFISGSCSRPQREAPLSRPLLPQKT